MRIKLKKAIQLITILVIGILLVTTAVVFAHRTSEKVLAAGPIPPPDGYPKLSLSTKVVSPTLAEPGGEILKYRVEIVNTGAYSASAATLMDTIPLSTTYNDDAQSSAPPTPVFTDGVITWGPGEVGFDTSVVISFSVTVSPEVNDATIYNTAVISDPMIAEPVTVTATTRVTDHPVFEISKTSSPELPGKGGPLTYQLSVTNVGQEAIAVPITVTDFVPTDTTFLDAGPDGSYSDGVVTWKRTVDLPFNATSEFTFSVNIDPDVVSGTVINNDTYLVVSPEEISAGMPYTVTVIDPIFILSKSIYPDPPGSNTEMTYTLTVFNLGSRATDLVITDTVPADVEYRRGGSYDNGVVTWNIPSLDTRESAQVTFTVYIADIADIIIKNGDYGVCSAQGACAPGIPTPSLIVGPIFEATAELDPIAKGTGGGTKPVTPTLTVKNLGPGNAIDAMAVLKFGRISISRVDLVDPIIGNLSEGFPCDDYFQCTEFFWNGDMSIGDVVTFTTYEGQSTIGGEQGTHYTATVVITDQLGAYTTEPVTGTAIGEITHFANLIPTKTAPPQIAPGQTMTYNIEVFDSAFTTEMEPPPVLTDTVPSSVTLNTDSISDGGSWYETPDGRTVVSWTLPAMGPGDLLFRSFTVDVDPDLVSGTLIINNDYRATWYESEISGSMSNLGEPVTTTVHEVGLIDSYKTVNPIWALPGTGTILTYTVHVVNSGFYDLQGVEVSDIFPWQHTTYQRDAVATSGELSSDIVSLEWKGDVAANSEQLITFTVMVDDFFEGVVTNTATISHESLREDKVVTAVAYITDKPVLFISKTASPDPVRVGGTLLYRIHVTNLGQQATLLAISDTVPAYTTYITGTASSGGQLVGDSVQWIMPVLNPGESLDLTFQVIVRGGNEIINDHYLVKCDEGVVAFGEPVVTRVYYPMRKVLLPLAFKTQ